MTPSMLREKVVTERIKWIREMIRGIDALPLDSFESFQHDSRNVAAAESYLRRALSKRFKGQIFVCKRNIIKINCIP